jgi:hypothetical protein
VTNQDARKFTAGLWLYFMQEVNEGSPISALETCADFVHCHQSREHGRVQSISSSITNCYEVYACLICKWIKFVFKVNIFL